MLKAIGTIVLALAAVCSAGFNDGVLYPFDINSQLVCHIPNPFYQQVPGEPPTIPAAIPRIPFASPIIVNDGFITGIGNVSRPYQLWLPQESEFRMPPLKGLDETKLLSFLGADNINNRLTSVEFPDGREPPKACELLPALEGSAGQRRVHVEVVEEPVPLFDEISERDIGLPDPFRTPVSLIHNQTQTDRDFADRVSAASNFGIVDFDSSNSILDQTNNFDQLWDSWIAKCPLQAKWVELPPSYFPRYAALSVCSGKNCSLPLGLTCQEDFTYTVFINVLRWDCCFNHLNRYTLWECGWRRVQIPVFCDCTCSCYEVSHP